jgi:hypothetical protein
MDLGYVNFFRPVQKRVYLDVLNLRPVTIMLVPPKMMVLVNIKVVMNSLSVLLRVVFLVKLIHLGAVHHVIQPPEI